MTLMCSLIILLVVVRHHPHSKASPPRITSRKLKSDTPQNITQTVLDSQTKKPFFDGIKDKIFEGKWTVQKDKTQVTPFSSGKLIFTLHTEFSEYLTSAKVFFQMKGMDGSTIDDFFIVLNESEGINFIVDAENKKMRNNSMTAILILGQVFEIEDEKKCRTTIEFETDIYAENSTYSQLKGNFQSTECNLNFSFEANLKEETIEWQKLFYCLIFTAIGLLNIVNAKFILDKVEDSIACCKAISIVSAAQSSVWSSMLCFFNFFMGINHDAYKFCFYLPSAVSLVSFTFFELRLIFKLYYVQFMRGENNPEVQRNLIIKFYCVFYLILFISMFLSLKVFFIPGYIVLGNALTWLPQIIYNFRNKNRVLLPYLSALTFVLTKLAMPVYARIYSHNIFELKYEMDCIVFSVAAIAFGYCIVLLQSVFGGRLFLKNDVETLEYCNRKDVIARIGGGRELDCVICLTSLEQPDNQLAFADEETGLDQTTLPAENSKWTEMKKVFLNNSLDFHSLETFFGKKPLVITKCNHAFHTFCFDSWIKVNRECPSCRTAL